MLDVLQIFGRAGRPQFDSSGHGIIITPYPKLHKYLSLLTNQIPIESCFVQHLVNNLNAEVCIINLFVIKAMNSSEYYFFPIAYIVSNLIVTVSYNISFIHVVYFIGCIRYDIKC